MKKYTEIFLLILFVFFSFGCEKNNEEENVKEQIQKDEVYGNYAHVYGLSIYTSAAEASSTRISDLDVSFKNGKYNVSYCADNILHTSSSCDIFKVEAEGSYTIDNGIMTLKLGSGGTTYFDTGEVVPMDTNQTRICKIIKDKEQKVIDCRDSGGWIYFEKFVDDEYYKEAECSEFDGKTYVATIRYNGFYLRDGTYVASPGETTKKIKFSKGQITDELGNIFENTGCEKISDTKYKIGIRTATYDKETDSFKIKIGTVDGINYGTAEFIEKDKQSKKVYYPVFSPELVCDDDRNCAYKNDYTVADMKKFAADNGLKIKIAYNYNNAYLDGEVMGYCDVEEYNTSQWCISPADVGREIKKGETFIIEVNNLKG